jgi:hypothetical protein
MGNGITDGFLPYAVYLIAHDRMELTDIPVQKSRLPMN